MTLPLAVLTLLCSVAFYAGGEYFSKLWGLHPSVMLLVAAVVCYWIGTFFWFPALLYRDQLSTIGLAWEVMAIASTLFLGLFFFHEGLSLKNWFGLALGLIAIWLLLT